MHLPLITRFIEAKKPLRSLNDVAVVVFVFVFVVVVVVVVVVGGVSVCVNGCRLRRVAYRL